MRLTFKYTIKNAAKRSIIIMTMNYKKSFLVKNEQILIDLRWKKGIFNLMKEIEILKVEYHTFIYQINENSKKKRKIQCQKAALQWGYKLVQSFLEENWTLCIKRLNNDYMLCQFRSSGAKTNLWWSQRCGSWRLSIIYALHSRLF